MKFPPYALLKAKVGSILNSEGQGKHLVFLPGAPDSWFDSVCIVDAERVTLMDTSVNSVNVLMKLLDKGSLEIIRISGRPEDDE